MLLITPSLHVIAFWNFKTVIYAIAKLFKDKINPLQLFVEKRQVFIQNNPWLNNIMYH